MLFKGKVNNVLYQKHFLIFFFSERNLHVTVPCSWPLSSLHFALFFGALLCLSSRCAWMAVACLCMQPVLFRNALLWRRWSQQKTRQAVKVEKPDHETKAVQFNDLLCRSLLSYGVTVQCLPGHACWSWWSQVIHGCSVVFTRTWGI